MSTARRPKQLLPLAGSSPLVVATVERARALVPDRRIRILAGEHLVDAFRDLLPTLPEDAYLAEPEARGTAPVLAWAAWSLARRDPDAVLVSLHADHAIAPLGQFLDVVRAAARVAARDDVLVTLGARPDRPETGYGYVQPAEPLEPVDGIRAHRVASFHEKPDPATAERYLEEGHLWNTGIFVWTAARFLREIRERAPEVGRHLSLLEEGDVEGFFAAVPRITVDVAVLERSDRVAVVPATFTWDDVGAWHALRRTRETDAAGNVIQGEARVVEGRDNVVWSEDGRIVLFGVDDLVAVRTGDVTLVTRMDRAADLKDLLDRLPPSMRGE